MENIHVGDIIQVTMEGDWQGCIMFVDEVKSWGVQTGMRLPFQGTTYMRLKWEQFVPLGGEAYLMPGGFDDIEEED